jgi:tripartite-type tricarboxylate transporter receptor subunit TctC
MAGGLVARMVIVLFAMGCAIAAHAQYPNKPIRMIVPYPAGGGTDIVARPVAQKLSERWGQPVVIENRGGATGMIGTEAAVRAPADGYTILFSASPEIVINLHLYPKMAYDPLRDLAFTTMGAFTPMIWVTHPSFPAANMKDFVAIAKAKPGQVSFGSSGHGSPHHIAGEWFRFLTKIDVIHVPFKGGGPQMSDQLGGHTISGIFTMPVATPHVRSGKLKGLAVTTPKRSTALPNVMTLIETGFPMDVTNWFAVSLPAKTSADIVNKVSADVGWALNLPEVRNYLVDQGYMPGPNSPEEFGKFVRGEVEKFRKIIADTKLKL